MARTANPVIEDKGVDIDASHVLAGQQYMAEHTALIMAEFGDDQPYDRSRYLDRARFHMNRSAEEALNAGRCLIVLKEHESHGEWLQILDQLGLHPRLAQRMAQAALKFSNPEKTAKLLEAAGSKSKVFELMVLDDEELEALNEGGTVAGLQLDDVERMSVTELRKALRDARDDQAAQRQILADKNNRIDELQTKLAKKPLVVVLPPDEQLKQLRLEAAGLAAEVEGAIASRLQPAVAALIEHSQQTGADSVEAIAGLIEQVERALTNLRAEYGIATHSAPAWLAADAEQTVAQALSSQEQ